MLLNGFLFLDEALTGLRWDAKYATWDNLSGKPLNGYETNRIVVSRELADALHKARKNAAKLGLGLLVWDAYRPQRAVDCLLNWAAAHEDNRTKARFYPRVERGNLTSLGYISAKSGHTRGGAVDLTLYRTIDDELLDMGGDFDYMDERSHHGAAGLGIEASKNRMLLCAIMESSGFVAYEHEWWHYMLKEEPYPDQHFDFVIGA